MPHLTTGNSREERIDNYWRSGARFYKLWEGMPYNVTTLAPALEWIRAAFRGATKSTKIVGEFSPGGGIWTWTILREMEQLGYPRQLKYYLFGQHYEHNLVLRDSIKPINKYIKYEEKARIRTYLPDKVPPGYDPTLISVLEFKSRPLDQIKETLEYDVMFCFDAFSTYSEYHQRCLIENANQRLKDNGILIIEIKSYEVKETMERFKLKEFTSGACFHDGDTTFIKFYRNIR
jgi:phospholipid N-methyltransferase